MKFLHQYNSFEKYEFLCLLPRPLSKRGIYRHLKIMAFDYES